MSDKPVRERDERRNNLSRKFPPPTLRPPTLMIDLLFGALMLFAFQMGDPSNRQIIASDIDLPSVADNTDHETPDVVALRPIHTEGGTWVYQLADGTVLDAEHVAQATGETSRLILVMGAADPIQAYVDAEQLLRKNGLSVGMAVELKEEEQ